MDKLTYARFITALKLSSELLRLARHDKPPRHNHSDCLTDQLTNSMQSSPSSKANSSSACQEVPPILCNPKVHYRVHNSPPAVSTPHYINSVHVTPPYCISITPVSIISSLLSFGLPSVRFPSGFTTKNL